MQIKVRNERLEIVYELNGSAAAETLYQQLPLTTKVKNFGSNEKIFYPDRSLPLERTPMADAENGTLAYYAPWGNVVIFYGYFGKGNGLYSLGEAVSGKENIEQLKGIIEVTAL